MHVRNNVHQCYGKIDWGTRREGDRVVLGRGKVGKRCAGATDRMRRCYSSSSSSSSSGRCDVLIDKSHQICERALKCHVCKATWWHNSQLIARANHSLHAVVHTLITHKHNRWHFPSQKLSLRGSVVHRSAFAGNVHFRWLLTTPGELWPFDLKI